MSANLDKFLTLNKSKIEAVISPTFVAWNVCYFKCQKVPPCEFIDFSYSHNLIEPPSAIRNDTDLSKLLNVSDILSDFSPDWWILGGKSVGYTYIYTMASRARRVLESTFGYSLPYSKDLSQPQIPLNLAYESTPNVERNIDYFFIFDVPPRPVLSSLSTHFAGSFYYSYTSVEAFTREIIEVAKLVGVKVYHKPKYSLSNYEPRYREFLFSLEKEFAGLYEVVDPYCRLGDYLRSARGCISIPWTSAQVFGSAYGVPSVYYVPARFASFFPSTVLDYVVVGREALIDYFEKTLKT